MATTEERKLAAFRRIQDASERLLDFERRPVPRDQHPKDHGCVKAKFIIRPDLPVGLKRGLFKEEKVYEAWVRFSNGRQRDDSKPDAHGMAVKVLNVAGPKAMSQADGTDCNTQDFIMVDSPVFFLRGAEDYADFSEAMLAAQGKIPSTVNRVLRWGLTPSAVSWATILLLYFFPWRLTSISRLRAFTSKLIANPLTTRYWSTTPYRFGPGDVMKFSARPVAVRNDVTLSAKPTDRAEKEGETYARYTAYLSANTSIEPQIKADTQTSPDYLREAMVASLKGERGAVFAFQVQLAQHDGTTPIDDPTVEWPEHVKPETVAWIWIEPQEFDDQNRREFAERLSFTPWHALEDHEPIGEINEIRKLVYERLSEARHEMNGAARKNDPPADPLRDSDKPAPWGNDPSAFGTVLEEELRLVWIRRNGLVGDKRKPIQGEDSGRDEVDGDKDVLTKAQRLGYTPGNEDEWTKAQRLRALREHVTGLAISGGGIRSGTFAVGFLQGLAHLGLIRRFDYLSTVSGGGYAGAWLVAWLKRQGGDPGNVEKMLSPSRVKQAEAEREYLTRPDGSTDPKNAAGGPNSRNSEVVDAEPEPIRHLRAYSSYLFPRGGLLSVDPWTVGLIWLRNVTINLMMLLPAIMMVVVLARLAVLLYGWSNPMEMESPGKYLLAFSAVLTAGFAAGVWAYQNNARALRLLRAGAPSDPSLSSLGSPWEVRALVNRTVLLPTFVAFFLLTLAIRPIHLAIQNYIAAQRFDMSRLPPPSDRFSQTAIQSYQVAFDFLQSHLDLLALPTFLGAGAIVGFLTWWGAWRNVPSPSAGSRSSFPWAPFFVGTLIGVLLPTPWAAIVLFLGLLVLAKWEGKKSASSNSSSGPQSYRPWVSLVAGVLGGALLMYLDTPTYVAVMLIAAAALLAGILAWWRGWRTVTSTSAEFLQAAFGAGATGGVLFVLVAGLIRAFARNARPDLMATFAAPLGVLVVVASLIVLVALLGRRIDEAEREWWARFSASASLGAAIWIGVFATVLYVPGLFLWVGPWMRAAIASGWLTTAAIGVLSGHYILPRLEALGGSRLTNALSTLSSLFLAGLVGAVALLASLLVNVPALTEASADDVSRFAHYLRGVNGSVGGQNDQLFVGAWLVGTGFVSMVLFSLARTLIDVNLFSLNAMYANRLTRCYLGASRPNRKWEDRWRLPRDPRAEVGAPSLSHKDGPDRRENPVTGFDPQDDLPLCDLRIGAGPDGRKYFGPHLLINTSLNLVGENSLQVRDRKGDSFTLSPLYCGSPRVGYSKLELLDSTELDDDLSLGRAISISGAAVDPNMSFYQSGPLTALLTLFNARLGYWIEKPGRPGWKARSPVFGDLFMNEFFGRTSDRGDFVHISDGGHFENLGVYELIRRRCRYIVAIDVDSDGEPPSDNLANLIRLCRIDFGVRIRIDVSGLSEQGPDRRSRSHVAIGSIHYEDVDRGEMPGVLVYVRSSLTGDESPDIQKYAQKNPRFPRQATDLRQSFDEEQFESYRCLGDHIAREVFADPVAQVDEELQNDEPPKTGDSTPHKDYVRKLFAAVQDRWMEAPDGIDSLYVAMNRDWPEIQADLALEPQLKNLSKSLYPDVEGPARPGMVQMPRQELHTVARMLAAMENAWLGLSMGRTSGLPLNRGWMNTFRRWAGSEAFRRAWPILRSEYSAQFVRFCEQELHLTSARPQAIPVGNTDDHDEAIKLMDQEFAREWPLEHKSRPGRGVKALCERSSSVAWLMAQATSDYDEEATDRSGPLYSGVIVAFPSDSDAASDVATELLVWVRQPYRQIGLGSACLRQVLKDLGKDKTLVVRYPDADPGEDPSYMSFVRFFARFDFRPTSERSYFKTGYTTLLRAPRT